MASLGQRLLRAAGRVVAGTLQDTLLRRRDDRMPGARRPAGPPPPARSEAPGRGHSPTPAPQRGAPPAGMPAYRGDFEGTPDLVWSPVEDDLPDPGEVVWAWVPYEEDHSRGKDRPVLVVGRHGGLLLALPLTSKDHDRDEAQEAAEGRHWCDVGSGAWDRRGRPSEARVDRVLQLDPAMVRRIGAVLPRERFEEVAAAVRGYRR